MFELFKCFIYPKDKMKHERNKTQTWEKNWNNLSQLYIKFQSYPLKDKNQSTT